MRRFLTLLTALLFLATSLPVQSLRAAAQGASAHNAAAATTEPDAGSVVCLPGLYTADDCLALGPSQYIAGLAALGIPYPVRSLPAYDPSPDLNNIPYKYFHVNPEGTPLFGSLSDAIAGTSYNQLAPGTVYVSYEDRVDADQGVYYYLRSGAWIGGDGNRLSALPEFQGLLLSSTPRSSFGWVLQEMRSRTGPGFGFPETATVYHHHEIIQVYQTQLVSDVTWNMVAPDEWLDGRYLSRVDPRMFPPEGVSSGRWIEINLAEQTLAVYQDNRMVFATLVSSGVDSFWTRPGLFQVYEKKETETMSGATLADRSDYYYLEDVPWTMYYDEKRALHGEYWHTQLGYQRSHGCVNLSIGDSHWLFDWASVGDFVYVYDPSGRTPTDPAIYGAGAP